MPIPQADSPLIERARKDLGRDTSIADEAKARGDVLELHSLCLRLLADRKQLAESFDAMVLGWSLLRDGKEPTSGGSDKDAIAAIEHVAHEAIAFAREVVQAMRPERKS